VLANLSQYLWTAHLVGACDAGDMVLGSVATHQAILGMSAAAPSSHSRASSRCRELLTLPSTIPLQLPGCWPNQNKGQISTLSTLSNLPLFLT